MLPCPQLFHQWLSSHWEGGDETHLAGESLLTADSRDMTFVPDFLHLEYSQLPADSSGGTCHLKGGMEVHLCVSECRRGGMCTQRLLLSCVFCMLFIGGEAPVQASCPPRRLYFEPHDDEQDRDPSGKGAPFHIPRTETMPWNGSVFTVSKGGHLIREVLASLWSCPLLPNG